MLSFVWRVFVLASFLDFLVEGMHTPAIEIGVARTIQLAYGLPQRRLQQSPEVTGCRWTQQGCKASGSYYAQTGALHEFDELAEELEKCYEGETCDRGPGRPQTCKWIATSKGPACVNKASGMEASSASELKQLMKMHGSIAKFRASCPLSGFLEADASQECEHGWTLLIPVTGCESCMEDVNFFQDQLTSRCREVQEQGVCESDESTMMAGHLICSRAEASARASTACADSEAIGGSRGMSIGAIAGIAIATIVTAILLVALIAWFILRSPRSLSLKKRAAAAMAMPQAPGADLSAHVVNPGAPYGAPGTSPHQPALPYAYGNGQPPAHSQIGPTAVGEVTGSMARMVPTDVYPSAEQFMASGHDSDAPAESAGGSCYGSTHAGAGSIYGGSVFRGAESQKLPSKARDSTDVARLPARDVIVKQIAHSGEPPAWDVSTRAAWDATASGTMPSPSTTVSSKPEDVLEAQLDYVAHHLSGSLLEDTRVGAWVIAAGLQRRISNRSAVVFVHGRNEPESAPATAVAAAAAPRQLRTLKFYFMKDDYDRNIAASQILDLKDVMPLVQRVESEPFNLSLPKLPPSLNMHALPSLIINEHGETLDEHVARIQPNFVTALSIMIQLAQVIERVHSVGWVHRDLKPSNCLFLAQPAHWTLIDWACAAKAGALTDVSFSLYYAPPETVFAYKAGQGHMNAHSSSDVWSLGVMAWELFTGRKFYGPAPDLQYVVKALAGEQPLPSEIELPPDIKQRLGNSMFRSTCLSMLHRDPQQRPSIRELLTSWESFFSQSRPN